MQQITLLFWLLISLAWTSFVGNNTEGRVKTSECFVSRRNQAESETFISLANKSLGVFQIKEQLVAPTNASGGDQSRPPYIGLTAHSLGNGQTVLDMQPGFHTIVNLSTWVHRGSSVHLGLFNRCIDWTELWLVLQEMNRG